MSNYIKNLFSGGYWTSDETLAQMAYSGLNRSDPLSKSRLASGILESLGWSGKKWYLNPIRYLFQSRLSHLVHKAVDRALAAYNFDQKAQSHLSSYEIIIHNEQNRNRFTPKEIKTLERTARQFQAIVSNDASQSIQQKSALWNQLSPLIAKTNPYLELKNKLNQQWRFNLLGVDIDKEVYHYVCNMPWHTETGWQNALQATDPKKKMEALQHLFGNELHFFKSFYRRAVSDQSIPLSDQEIQRLLDATGLNNDGAASMVLLSDLEWPIVQNIYENFDFHSPAFFRLKNEDLSSIKNIPAFVQLLRDNHSALWKHLSRDGEAKIQNKMEVLFQQNPTLPLWDILLTSAKLDEGKKETIRIEVNYQNLFTEIKKEHNSHIVDRIQYLKNLCPQFYQYLQRKNTFTDDQLKAIFDSFEIELVLRNPSLQFASPAEKHKQVFLYFFTKIHWMDKFLTPLFEPFTDAEKAQFLKPTAMQTDEIKDLMVRFASSYEESIHQLSIGFSHNPFAPFVVSQQERQLINQGDEIVKQAALHYRKKIKEILQSNPTLRKSIDETIKDRASQLTDNRGMTVQMEKDLPRLNPTNIVRYDGYWRPQEVTSSHSGSSNSSFLSDLSKLHQRLSRAEGSDLYLLQEMLTQTTQNFVAEIITLELKAKGLHFKPFPITPILVNQEMREISSNRIQLKQTYNYNQIDHLNAQRDTHSFEVIYTFIKDRKGSRVEFTSWKYLPNTNLTAAAEQLERNDQAIVDTLSSPPEEIPVKPTYGQWAWNGVKWAASPITTLIDSTSG